MDSFANSPLDFDLCNINEVTAAEPPAPARTSFAIPLSTGTSGEGLFSSPSSLASGSTGGVKVGSTLGLVYVGNVLGICGGVIQNSDQRRFCTKAAGTCSTKTHKTARVNLVAETLYVKHSRNGHALLKPSLPVDLLSDDMPLAEMLSTNLSLEIWTAHFDSLKAEKAGKLKRSSPSSYGSTSPWEEVEIATLENLKAASESLYTPKKLRLGSVLSLETLPVTSRPRETVFSKVEPQDIDDEDSVETSKIQRALQVVMSEWNQLNSTFQLIYMEFDKNGLNDTKYRNTIAATLGDIQGALRGTDAKLQLLGAGIGTKITETEEGPMSVWDAIRKLRADTLLVGGVADGHHLYLDELRKKLPNWSTTLENLAKSYRENLPTIGSNLNSLGQRILSLETRSQSTAPPSNAFFTIGNPPASSNGGPACVAQTEFDQAKADIHEAFTDVKTAIDSLQQSNPGGGGSGGFPPGVEQKVDKALKRLGEIEGRATGESFTMNGQSFCSRSEVADWLLVNKVPSCGFFWDLFSVMVSMKPKKHSGKERSDEHYSARRTNSTTLENDLGASMTHVRPEVLYAKRGHGDLERLEAGFAACSSYAIWVTGTECYKDQLTGMLNKFCDGVLGTVPPMATYENLVNNLMGGVRTQWHNMCTFIDSFYVELTGVAGFNKEKAWKLVGRCVAALFSSLEPYRSPVTMLEDMNTLDNKAACLWAVLQCHRVGKSFDLVKYRGHPAVVKEMSLFMLTERVDPSEIEACTERSRKAEKEALDAKNEVSKLRDLVNTLNREFKTTQADIKALKLKK
jgi:hypothetical protein